MFAERLDFIAQLSVGEVPMSRRPTPSRELLQYVSVAASGKLIRRVARGRFEGLYHVCGGSPWLYIRRHDLRQRGDVDPRPDVDLRRVRSGMVSWATGVETFDTDAILPVTAFVFARPLPAQADEVLTASQLRSRRSRGRKLLLSTLRADRVSVLRLSDIVDGEWWYVVEAGFETQTHLSDALRSLSDVGLDTATKCVLVPWIHRGKSLSRINASRRDRFAESPAPELDHRVAMVVRNSRTFFSDFRDLQSRRNTIRADVERGWEAALDPEPTTPTDEQLCWTTTGTYLEPTRIEHPNGYVKRFTLRPVSEAWSVVFVFLRAERHLQGKSGGVARLRERLRGRVGVGSTYLLPRVYRITGEFDYLLVAYVLGPAGRRNLLATLATRDMPIEGKPVVLTASIPSPCERGTVENLSVPSKNLATALFRNAVNADAFFEDEFPELMDIWTSRRRLKELEVPLASLSARARAIYEFSGRGQGDRPAQSLLELGLGVTWELSDKVNAAFVRLRPSALEASQRLYDAIRERTSTYTPESRQEILFDWYVSDQEEVLGIARYRQFAELERFLYFVRPHCSRTEFHIVLDQIPAFPDIPETETCLPCVEPANSNLEHVGKDCGTCSRYARHWGSAAARKILVEKRGERPLRPQCVVGLLDLSLSMEECEELRQNDRKLSDLTGEYADALVHLIRGPFSRCDLIVLPEYCVPRNVAQRVLHKLESLKRKREQLVVLGTHLYEHVNLAPILWSCEKSFEVYLQAKRRRSRQEQARNMLKRMGDAAYVFRTRFGNITVAICSDTYGRGDGEQAWYADADVVAVPSYHPGGMETLLQGMQTYNTRFRAVAFANGAARPGRKRRVTSRVLQFGDSESGISEEVRLGPFIGAASVVSVDLLANDRRRAKPVRGRPPRGVIPLHVDLWKDQATVAEGSFLKAILQDVGNAIAVRGRSGELREHALVEWKEAHDSWRGRR